jgi:hypothetical protein
MSTSVDNPVQPCPKKDSDVTQDRKKFWIKFKVVDADSNKPMENVVVDLTLPGGQGTILLTDDKGQIDIKNIDSGTCLLVSDWRDMIKLGFSIEQMVLI